MQGKISGKRNKSFIYGESRIFRNCVNIRRTDVEYIFPEYLPATQIWLAYDGKRKCGQKHRES